MSHNIIVESGKAFRLLTSGKYCDQDIIITAEGGKEDLDVVLTEQDNLIDELREVLKSKGSGESEPVIEPLEVTENGAYAAPAGVDGYSPVTVNVPVPDGYIVPSGSKTITENGTHDVAEFASVEVSVEAGGGGGGDDLTEALISGHVEGDVTFQSAVIGRHGLSYLTFSGDVYLPNATAIMEYGFAASEGNRIFAPKVEVLGQRAFSSCKVKRIELPECHTLNGDNTFIGSGGLSTLEVLLIPKVTSLPYQACYNQPYLHTVDVSSVATIGEKAFQSCGALTALDFPALESITGTLALAFLPNLKALVLRKESVCTISADRVLANSSIDKGSGHIYVPRALVDSYKTANYWSTYAAQFRALEDYTVDGTITGALDETKI